MANMLQSRQSVLSKHDFFAESPNYLFSNHHQKEPHVFPTTNYLADTADNVASSMANESSTAPCERRQNYVINDTMPKATTNCSTIEFGSSTTDLRPLAFKTVSDRILADRELYVFHVLGKAQYLVHMEDTFVNDKNEQVIVMPVLKKLDIAELDLVQVSKIMRQLLSALNTIHSKHIVHLDVTPANLMSNNSDDLVLIDFGLAHHLHPSSRPVQSARGTPGYIAPELFECPHALDARADIYSAGIILGQMLDGYFPTDIGLQFLGGMAVRRDTTDQVANNLDEFLLTRRAGAQPYFTSYPPPSTPHRRDDPYPVALYDAADLLVRMLKADPCLRPSAEKCLQSPFFTCPAEQFDKTERSVVQERVRMFCYHREQFQCGYGFGASSYSGSYYGGYREIYR